MKSDLTHKLRTLTAIFVLCLLPTTTWSVELFEGNLGYEGDWLHVWGSAAMTDRVYWYDLGTDISYRFQLSSDEAFSAVVLDIDAIADNFVEPDVEPGLYYFRVSAFDASGTAVSASDTGTLEVVADSALPSARIVSPREGEVFHKGDTLSVELEVSDDTVLHLARFTIGGEYVGVLGLKTENYKIKPSFGEPRTVSFDYQIPTNGPIGALEIAVEVSDVLYNTVRSTVSIECTNDGATTKSRSNKGRGKKK